MDKEFFNGMNLAEDISEEDFQYINLYHFPFIGNPSSLALFQKDKFL